MPNVVWSPQPRQAVFMARPEYEALYGGAAGGGKSDALVIEALRQVHVPHYKALILRKTFPQLAELVDKTLNYYPRAFPEAKYNGSSHTWTFPSGAKIIFGAMQYTKDRTKYQGQAYDAQDGGEDILRALAEEMTGEGPDTGAAQVQKTAVQTDGGVRYSLKEFSDGRRFVDVDTDQSQFDGLTTEEMRKVAVLAIKNKFAGKVIGIDNKAFVNGQTAKEYGHPAKRISGSVYEAKLRASTELDNLLDAGTNFRTEPDGQAGHIHPEAVGDFRYFDTIFKVGGEYYSGVINIEPVAKGLLLKDITKIENITQDIYSSYGQSPKSVFLRDASMNSISQTDVKSNSDFSLNGGEDILAQTAQELASDEVLPDDQDMTTQQLQQEVMLDALHGVDEDTGEKLRQTAAEMYGASQEAEVKAAGYAPVDGTDAGLVADDYVKANVDSKVYRQLNTLCKALGVRARFVDGSEVLNGRGNAQIKGREVLIAKDHQHPLRFVLGHELTHRIQQLAPESYQVFRDFVAQDPAVRNDIEYKRRSYAEEGIELDYAGALDEAVADYAGEMLEDGRVMDEFIERHRTDKTLLEKMRDAIRGLIDKLTGKEKKQAQTAEGKLNAALDAAAEQAQTLTEQSGGKETAATVGGEVRYELRTAGGKQVVWVEDNPLTSKGLHSHTAVAEYLAKHIGEVYTIIESGQNVYLGEDLPTEYTQSKYTSYLRAKDRKGLKAKNRAVSGLGELIEAATNRRWEKTRHPQSKDAKYGMYRYDSTLAFPVKDNAGATVGVRAYDVELLIRNASDGKKYLYDIVNIKENTTAALDLQKRETRRGG